MPLTLWVIAPPAAPHMQALKQLPDDVHTVVGKEAEAFANAGSSPDVVMVGSAMGDVLSQIWPLVKEARWIHSLSAGVEGVIIPELRDSKIPLTNGRGVFARSLGEYAVAAMLHFAKDLRRMVRQQEQKQWIEFDVEELHGRTLGIVGYGSIGQAAAHRAKPFGMRVVALRRKPEPAPDVDVTLPPERLQELLQQSDYVLVATPLTPQTRGLIGEAELRAMKPNAVIMNLGRGPVIVEDALVKALQEGRIRGAALDVFDQEPLPAEHPFYTLPNVLLSPHCADHTATWLFEAMDLFIENFRRFQQGQPLQNVVDKHAGY